MSSSLRDLGQRAGSVPAPQLDVAALVAAGESRLRRRRLAAVAAVTAAVVAVVGGALIASPGTRQTAPPIGPDRTHAPDDVVETRPAARLLTYSVGTVIHWGDRTIDVGQVAHGRQPRRTSLDYLDATDDGVVFITGPQFHDGGIGYGASAVWFTDGSTPVRIGTAYGSAVRGFSIATSVSGSVLAWKEPGDASSELLQKPFGPVVVYDTARMREVGRFGGADAFPFDQVYDDAVYWSTGESSCELTVGLGRATGCSRTATVMRFDPASGIHSQVRTADYLADRRSRPGLLTVPPGHGRASGAGGMFTELVRRGRRLVAVGDEPGAWFVPTVAMTGQPVRLRMPAGDRTSDALAITQWLDADRVVLVAPHSYGGADGTELLVCRLSTGGCRLAVRFPDANFTEPGPAGIHG